jgi:hypothetical protein
VSSGVGKGELDTKWGEGEKRSAMLQRRLDERHRALTLAQLAPWLRLSLSSLWRSSQSSSCGLDQLPYSSDRRERRATHPASIGVLRLGKKRRCAGPRATRREH